MPGVLELIADADGFAVVVGDGEVEGCVIADGWNGGWFGAEFVDVGAEMLEVIEKGLVDEGVGDEGGKGDG